MSSRLEEIVARRFNGEVLLDGRRFIGCTFERGCTLVYRNHAEFGYQLEDCVFDPGIRIETPTCPGLAAFIWQQIWRNAAIQLQRSST